jgi:type I restriction enzyme S subunit
MLHKSDYVPDGVPLINPTNIEDENIVPDLNKQVGAEAALRLESYVLKVGDVIVGRRGEIGRCAVIGQEQAGWICGTGCFFVRPLPTVNSRFLARMLRSPVYRDRLERGSTGSTMKNVSNTTLAQLLVAVPAPLEQRRIVAILDEAFEGIATAKVNAEKNLQNASELFESHLDATLSRHAEGCTETTLGAEVSLLVGYAFASGGYTDVSDAVRLLRGDNIMQGYLRWDEAKMWPVTDCAPYSRFALQEGDVVLAMDRPWVKAGLKRAQIAAVDLPCLLVQRTACLRPKQALRKDFLLHLISSRSFSQHLLGVQTGIGVPHISGKQIESFRFMRPSLRDQQAIAARLDELRVNTDCMAEGYERKLAALDELKKSLLHQAFSGAL